MTNCTDRNPASQAPIDSSPVERVKALADAPGGPYFQIVPAWVDQPVITASVGPQPFLKALATLVMYGKPADGGNREGYEYLLKGLRDIRAVTDPQPAPVAETIDYPEAVARFERGLLGVAATADNLRIIQEREGNGDLAKSLQAIATDLRRTLAECRDLLAPQQAAGPQLPGIAEPAAAEETCPEQGTSIAGDGDAAETGGLAGAMGEEVQ